MPITCEFYKYCEIIRKFGFKLKKSVNSFTDNSAVKRIYLLNVSEKKLCLYLEETYTSLEISFSYKDTHESRNLRGNIISNKFTKSSKNILADTKERKSINGSYIKFLLCTASTKL